jgi:hypothetical protein
MRRRPSGIWHRWPIVLAWFRRMRTNLVSDMPDSVDVGLKVRSFGHIRHMFS